MGGYISNSLEETVAVTDFLHDFEGRCLIVIYETEGNH